MRRRLLGAVLVLAPISAMAQQMPPDPRLSGPTIAALQAMLTLREAQAKIVAEDAAKRIAELEKLCGEPCKPKPDTPKE